MLGGGQRSLPGQQLKGKTGLEGEGRGRWEGLLGLGQGQPEWGSERERRASLRAFCSELPWPLPGQARAPALPKPGTPAPPGSQLSVSQLLLHSFPGPAQAATKLLSICMIYLDISYKCTQILCGFLHLVSFIWYIFVVHMVACIAILFFSLSRSCSLLY